jgi:pyruvate dehydrogenase E2 component (dihydrolipoamide acetyltransferase)
MPIPITMPRLSDTMESGTIIKWNVKEGDKVSAGDVIADVETDKATMEMAAYDDGTVAKIEVPEGKSVSVGTVIAVLAGEGEDAKDAAVGGNGEAASKSTPRTQQKSSARDAEPQKDREAAKMTEAEPAQPKRARQTTEAEVRRIEPEPKPARAATAEHEQPREGRTRVSPVARLLAEEHNINLRSIEGTGPGGRIIKRDVLQAMEAAEETAAAVPQGAIEPAKPRELPAQRVKVAEPAREVAIGAPGAMRERSIQLSSMRQTIAKRLVESKTTIPHYQVTVTFNMDPLLELRGQLNEQLQSQGVKLSVNDFLVRACALAMYRHPEFNASWAGDHVEIHGDINIGIAISIPAERGGGLVVGTLRNADQKSLRVISFESKSLAEKARTRGLSIAELSDSTFTISNLGMYGVDNFTAIINPPNSAIIAVGAAIERPVVRDHQLTIGHEMSGTLSCDHRVIDGAMAAEYLQTVKQLIESPGALIV